MAQVRGAGRRAWAGVGGVVVAAVLLSGCAKGPAGFLASGDKPQPEAKAAADLMGGRGTPDGDRAYYGAALAKDPKDERAAIAYARLVKAESKEKAMGVLQQAAMYNPESRAIASEQARLAVDLGQFDFAEKLIARAEDPSRPDWRLVSAKGTIAAKRGDKKGALAHFQAAYKLAPKEPSVLNNLALAYALNGEAGKAEQMLKQARSGGGDSEQVRQNLALVLGVQGKFTEAETVAAADLNPETAKSNASYLRRMAKAEAVATPVRAPVQTAAAAPKPAAPAAIPSAKPATKVAAASGGKATKALRPSAEPVTDKSVTDWAAAIAQSGN